MTAPTLRVFFLLCAVFSVALSDTYMHNPRGSNNRLNERSANRQNANRLFNSQVKHNKTPKWRFLSSETLFSRFRITTEAGTMLETLTMDRLILSKRYTTW